MPTVRGHWQPTADGAGVERFTTEDGVLHREYVGCYDQQIAMEARILREDVAAGRNPKMGNIAFHMPEQLLTHLYATEPDLSGTPKDQKAFWKRFESTKFGKMYKVRGV